jgi:hypothetical protein
MKANTLLAIAAAAALALPFAAASAAGDRIVVAQVGSNQNKPVPPGDGLFRRLDANHDGYVSRDEARDAKELQGRFAEFDVDNDGKLSRQELQALNPEAASGGTGGSTGPAGSSSSAHPYGEAPKSGKSR